MWGSALGGHLQDQERQSRISLIGVAFQVSPSQEQVMRCELQGKPLTQCCRCGTMTG